MHTSRLCLLVDLKQTEVPQSWFAMPWHQLIQDIVKQVVAVLGLLCDYQASFIACSTPISYHFHILSLNGVSISLQEVEHSGTEYLLYI